MEEPTRKGWMDCTILDTPEVTKQMWLFGMYLAIYRFQIRLTERRRIIQRTFGYRELRIQRVLPKS
jgi:hypothetical protein